MLAATALSLSPIFFSIRQIDAGLGAAMRLGALLALFAVAMLMFLRVLAPVSGRAEATPRNDTAILRGSPISH